MPAEPLYGHSRTPSSQFTLTTYPGGSPYDTTLQLQRPGGLSFLLSFRRRRYCLIIVVVVFLLGYGLIYFSTSSGKTVSIDTQFSEVVDSATSKLASQTTVSVTLPAQSTATQSNDAPQQSEAVVFVLVVWSRNSAIEGALLIKSILMYNTSPSEFHIICDDDAEEFLRSRFALVHQPRHDILVRFYKPTWQSMLDRIDREGTISTDHSAGVPGLMKLFLHEIISVEQGIYIDTDAFFISDPTLLWKVFKDLKASTAIVMSSHPDQDSPEWNHASRICSCVMLLELEKLRSLRLMDSSIYRSDSSNRFAPALAPEAFRAMYGLPGGDGHGRYDNVRLGDQGYWWAIVDHRPDIYEPLSYDFEVTSCLMNTYNTGLGDDAVEETIELSRQSFLEGTPQEGKVVRPKLLHFNCLHGTDVYMDWKGWSNPDELVAQRWGPAVKYHNGYKWIWLNIGHASVRMETIGVTFADERFASDVDSGGANAKRRDRYS